MKTRPKLCPISEEMKQWSAMLHDELNAWPGVASRPMFGMTAFYRKEHIFALLPLTRSFKTPSSIAFKLYHRTPKISKLLRSDPRIRSSGNRIAGWIGFEVNAASEVRDALEWFDLAYRTCLFKNNSKR